ncbi:hypothetical protein GCM10023238_38930 [Streptomyces heliomycini]
MLRGAGKPDLKKRDEARAAAMGESKRRHRVSLHDDAVLVLKGYEGQPELRQAYQRSARGAPGRPVEGLRGRSQHGERPGERSRAGRFCRP